MKTLACLCLYEGNMTGGPKRTLDVMDCVRKNGVRPFLITSAQGDFTDLAQQNGFDFKIVSVPDSLRAKGGVSTMRFSARAFGLWDDVVNMRAQVYRILRDSRADGVWSRSLKGHLFSGHAARRLGIKSIWDIGTEYPASGLALVPHLLGLHSADAIIAQSKFVIDDIFPHWVKKIFEKKFKAFVPGLPPEREAVLISSRDRRDDRQLPCCLTLIGTVNRRKNQLLFLESSIRLWDSGRKFKIRFVGPVTDEKYYARLLQRADVSGYAERIEWVGWCDSVADELANATALVICSTGEGMPQVLLEACLSGCPVASVPVGGVAELIVDGISGYLSKNHSVKSFALSVDEFLNTNVAKRSDLAAKAYDRYRMVASFEAWQNDYGIHVAGILR